MSIPTSLIIVILVAAWLAVLVPMVARRREQVPETETDGRTFRVLRRASASVRRRPKLGRRPDLEEDDITESIDTEEFHTEKLHIGEVEIGEVEIAGQESAGLRIEGRSDDESPDEELLEEELLDDDDADDEEGFAGEDRTDGPEAAELEESESGGDERPVRTVGRQPERVRQLSGSTRFAPVDTEDHEADTDRAPVTARGYEADEAEWYEDDYVPLADGRAPRSFDGERDRSRRDPQDGVDEAKLRPIPRRPGRGGYDPEAAEAARAYRYSRRRRITVVLLLATVAFSVAAYLFKPILWCGTALFGVLLIAYLGYLRRQVRIEKDIRERRLARLRRARQIRPEYHVDRPVTGDAYDSAAVSQVPPSGYRRGRQIVDFEDDDPSFDELEYYEPAVYRRASGQ